jgi:hypothetical protein
MVSRAVWLRSDLSTTTTRDLHRSHPPFAPAPKVPSTSTIYICIWWTYLGLVKLACSHLEDSKRLQSAIKMAASTEIALNNAGLGQEPPRLGITASRPGAKPKWMGKVGQAGVRGEAGEVGSWVRWPRWVRWVWVRWVRWVRSCFDSTR